MGLNGKSAKTVNGADVKISTDGGVKLNGTSNSYKNRYRMHEWRYSCNRYCNSSSLSILQKNS